MTKEEFEKLKSYCVQHGLTVAVAESITAGRIQAGISEHSGASDFFAGGVTAYNIDQKVNLLKVDEENARITNCVSEQTSREMAEGVKKLFNADIGISSTGYAEKNDDNEPHAFIAISYKTTTLKRVDLSSNVRVENQDRVATEAIRLLIDTSFS